MTLKRAKWKFSSKGWTQPISPPWKTVIQSSPHGARGGWVIVLLVGDITGPNGLPDGKCDMRDIGLVARNFGLFVPPAPANCDLTGPTAGVPDGKIDMRDAGLVARHFGETGPYLSFSFLKRLSERWIIASDNFSC